MSPSFRDNKTDLDTILSAMYSTISSTDPEKCEGVMIVTAANRKSIISMDQ